MGLSIFFGIWPIFPILYALFRDAGFSCEAKPAKPLCAQAHARDLHLLSAASASACLGALARVVLQYSGAVVLSAFHKCRCVCGANRGVVSAGSFQTY
jgi:hypothetical protein